MIQPGREHMVHDDLFPGVNGIGDVPDLGIAARRLGRGLEGGTGKTVIEVVIQNDFAVFVDLGIRKPLSGRNVEIGECSGQGGFVACDMQGPHSGLWTFLDLQRDSQIVLLALIVILHLGGNLGVQKAIGVIWVRDQVADIRVQQGLAVTAVRQKAPGRLDLHAGPNLLFAEGMVAGDGQPHQLVPLARVDVVGHPHFAGRDRVLLHRHFGIEVTQPLHIVEQVAPAFVQQVIVEGIFFVHRDVPLDLAAADLETFDRDFNLGSGLDFKSVVHRIAFRTIGPAGDRDLGQEAVLLLILFSQPVQGTADALHGHVVRSVHLGNVLNLSHGKSRRTAHRDAADPGVVPGRDPDEHIHLLGLRLRLLFVPDRRLVVAVLLHQLFDADQTALQLFPGEQFSQLQLGCIHDLVGGRGSGSSFHENLAHKKVGPHAKGQHHLAVRGALGLGLNIGKTPGGMQRLDALPHLFAFQRGTNPLRNQVRQSHRARRGQVGKVNFLNDKPFVGGHSSHRRQRRSGFLDRRGPRGCSRGRPRRRLRLCCRTQAE